MGQGRLKGEKKNYLINDGRHLIMSSLNFIL